jgi:hypothetical protein
MKRLVASIAAVALLAAATPGSTHHSTNLAYDSLKVQTYEGEFVGFRWINPHAILQFNVTGPNGQKELWSAETHGAGVLGRFGWTPKMFKPGEKLVLSANPPRKPGAKAVHVLSVKAANGKVYNVNRENPA